LRVAIESVRRQSFDAWGLRVVGDHCDHRTAEVVQSFDDDRIEYTNLPIRFGEQSGPTSIGIALARGSYVALLNHDDVWLQDHLEQALGSLRREHADFYVGRSVFARRTTPHEVWGAVPIFSEINPRRRFAADSFTGQAILFEPASAWVIRTPAARSVGNWRAAARLYRTPAQEWVLRAWRAGLRLTFGALVTVLKVVTHYQHVSEEGSYSRRSTEHEYLADLVRSKSPGVIRGLACKDLDEDLDHRAIVSTFPQTRAQHFLHWTLINGLTAWVYRLTGIDGYELHERLMGRKRGEWLWDATRKRTGETPPDPPDVSTVLEQIRADPGAT
jgi:glycosyltransferase involved in cell wall biosynthesis